MAKGIILVETFPSSPEREQEYNTWYDEVHLPELVALDGFVSARRLRPVDADGLYEPGNFPSTGARMRLFEMAAPLTRLDKRG